ncbi:hypothetical protein fugu_007546 [Takifugu bimaculatus]|uniref:Dilute domain-containing protein n=1 Tax=Takifugu bimaculatus TaxID=433685 RepID=A0A4Z2B051_9TELE|nr:hypothetical protein fugu_007546 [Takifugu bimaculatus]
MLRSFCRATRSILRSKLKCLLISFSSPTCPFLTSSWTKAHLGVGSKRSKVLQIQACMRMVLEWAGRSGLGHLSDKFFTKLNSTVTILATPPQQLTQSSWRALSSEHSTLKPVQLHRILTQYQLTAEIGPVPTWQPGSEDEAAGFSVDLDSECVEDSIYRQLLYIRHFLWGLRTKAQAHTNTPGVQTHSNGTNTADWPDVQRELLAPNHNSPRSGGPWG